jgi:hypothetical protein
VPWQLGHISTITGITGITGGFDRNRPLTLVTTVATYGLIAATLASVALGDGRALHDRTRGHRRGGDRGRHTYFVSFG